MHTAKRRRLRNSQAVHTICFPHLLLQAVVSGDCTDEEFESRVTSVHFRCLNGGRKSGRLECGVKEKKKLWAGPLLPRFSPCSGFLLHVSIYDGRIGCAFLPKRGARPFESILLRVPMRGNISTLVVVQLPIRVGRC